VDETQKEGILNGGIPIWKKYTALILHPLTAISVTLDIAGDSKERSLDFLSG
jgi:hypothetical protein